jgi:hypothetical protein
MVFFFYLSYITFITSCYRSQIVYEPKVRLQTLQSRKPPNLITRLPTALQVKYYVGDKQPPKISDGFFSWLSPLMHTKEPELLDKVGLDAVTFLRFLRMLRWLFLGVSLLSCGVLIPINVVYNIQNVDKDTRNSLSILTIQDVKGTILFAHVAVTYIISTFRSFSSLAFSNVSFALKDMAVLFAIWWHWKAVRHSPSPVFSHLSPNLNEKDDKPPSNMVPLSRIRQIILRSYPDGHQSS